VLIDLLFYRRLIVIDGSQESCWDFNVADYVQMRNMSSGSVEVDCLPELGEVDGSQEDFLIRILGLDVAIE
jgi:hypothetical protein